MTDAIPILFIAWVHNSTFRDIEKTKQFYSYADQYVVYQTDQSNDPKNATFLGESKFSIITQEQSI